MSLAPCEIRVTTFELSARGATPTLRHTFYGRTLAEAQGVASSHLITDYFFSSSFIGSMQWGNTVLRLSNQYEVECLHHPTDRAATQALVNRLSAEARKVNQAQVQAGTLMVIQTVRGMQ
jgi:hypothetical protein